MQARGFHNFKVVLKIFSFLSFFVYCFHRLFSFVKVRRSGIFGKIGSLSEDLTRRFENLSFRKQKKRILCSQR
ncbi:hypothetical protein LEP1GSC043_2334 [Leptospira weilii str. Ecochallenge]|uniref:Uncharacterized protein n=2 Tax=Leptospira weilii TaxID=28184 RepID=N1U6X8_9LEPT|nr:hypothetical protein LEP1GSC108_1922 [Leptospira weilii str. UI 13098]EMY16268.1 hypothetical protein LEP1GSC043_2334 [Leptospira weilii str. Ecochallenge]